jgi:rod shape-determining protein MreC
MTEIPGAHRSHVLLLALLVAHLLVISWQVETQEHVSLLEHGVLTLLAPPQRLLAAVLRGVGGAWHGYADLRGVRVENQRLAARVGALELALAERENLAAQAERLRELLELRELVPYETITAELVAGEGGLWASAVTVNKGSADGVTLNMPALCTSGVVGRVIALGSRSAKVQLILNPSAGVGVLIARSRTVGVLEGLGPSDDPVTGDLPIRFVPALADVVVGDVVVTSGLDQIYPKGLSVGRVSRVSAPAGLVKQVSVAPAARFHELEEVLLLRNATEPLEMTESVR